LGSRGCSIKAEVASAMEAAVTASARAGTTSVSNLPWWFWLLLALVASALVLSAVAVGLHAKQAPPAASRRKTLRRRRVSRFRSHA